MAACRATLRAHYNFVTGLSFMLHLKRINNGSESGLGAEVTFAGLKRASGLILPTLRHIGRAHLVLGLIALGVLSTEPKADRYGDTLQIALPVIAFGCEITSGRGAEFGLRFFGLMAAVHGTKWALGDAPINQRPHGGSSGMPSAHTAAATLGASNLAQDCLASSPVAKAAVVFAAAFVGGSRIEAGSHNIWQVLVGGLAGWVADRILRRPSRTRSWVSRLAMSIRQRVAARLGRRLPAP